MSKRRCITKGVAFNVLRELSFLRRISHPFIVNLWYTFQVLLLNNVNNNRLMILLNLFYDFLLFHDRDYMYMVTDLLLGGDLRFHLNQQGKFAEDRSKLYMCEISLAIEYLHEKRIIHRDIKPENILLDEQGHAHLTDLNLATQLEANELATSYSGTRPYMAPEVYACALGLIDGYDFKVDWWSLGVTFYEMMRGRTPYEFSHHYTAEQALLMIRESYVPFPAHWPTDLLNFLRLLICPSPEERIDSLATIKRHPYTARIDFSHVLARRAAPVFVPCKEGLNCDPMYELEERILVSTPIHRRRHNRKHCDDNEALREISQAFIDYSRDEAHSLVNGVAR
ncbi:kinase domain protein [Dictyocaulus viviparus]|uniref:Kinase domain protein n=1 Tax=Dictyocaulus viviparus TaxID=29172 RepID=A0A0D8YAR6_DICVI|nr:kinase domain protein [Dictyocaulus viviparus]